MYPYMKLLSDVYSRGRTREDRTGVGTRSLFGEQVRIGLSISHFPLLTTKRINTKPMVAELAWFLRGDADTEYLHDQGVKLWDPWADEDGYVGPIYGFQWRRWGADHDRMAGIDQIREVVESIKEDPYSRRHIVSAWNVSDLPEMALPPCPILFQFYVNDGELSCHVYQRSADAFLGLPFDIAEYALLTHLIAKETGLIPAELIFSFGDVHIYNNHLDQVKTQLLREPGPLPRLVLAKEATIDNFEPSMALFEAYNPHPALKGKVAV